MGGLRIISGKARGRKLKSVPGDSTRPITDRTKESLFNIIGGDIIDSSFLDLFAGTGSVGIEALSRSAAFVRFIDKYQKAIETIRFNIALCKLQNTPRKISSEVIRGDAFKYLTQRPDRSFDYIYIAPPQYKEMWERALITLDKFPDWMDEDAWVIAQIHPIEYTMLDLQNLDEFMQRKYGSTLLVFYEVKR
jgi:16S rRNA (guanine(966)-N(2))-methyltransferase RsmD